MTPCSSVPLQHPWSYFSIFTPILAWSALTNKSGWRIPECRARRHQHNHQISGGHGLKWKLSMQQAGWLDPFGSMRIHSDPFGPIRSMAGGGNWFDWWSPLVKTGMTNSYLPSNKCQLLVLCPICFRHGSNIDCLRPRLSEWMSINEQRGLNACKRIPASPLKPLWFYFVSLSCSMLGRPNARPRRAIRCAWTWMAPQPAPLEAGGGLGTTSNLANNWDENWMRYAPRPIQPIHQNT